MWEGRCWSCARAEHSQVRVRWGVCGISNINADEIADSLNNTDASLLLDKLGGLPLALVQAGAYIRARNLTAEKYIAHYEKTWDKLMAYQDRYPRQEYAERSVLTTWKERSRACISGCLWRRTLAG